MLEVGEAGKAIGCLNDGGALAGFVGEGNEGAALVVTFIAAASEPDGTASGWFMRFIEDGDYFASAGRRGKELKLALANEGPATLT